MVTKKKYDAVVIGAGAAGMAAACAMAEAGVRVAVCDREEYPGGILQQCIHNGFGLHHFKREMTGPEYADEYIAKISSLPVDLYCETTIVEIRVTEGKKRLVACSGKFGVIVFEARAIVLAMGCRERNRGNIGIPGSRPAGVLTAGLAQRLINIDGCVPGGKVVIVGSGDIGLIMARRFTWIGCTVRCVVEIMPYPSGLTRNIVQCLQDFSIPLYLNHVVTKIIGRDRVRAVEIAPLANGVPMGKKRFMVDCDTVLLSVGLIPENEISRNAGIRINPETGGPFVDYTLQTETDGVFACGNVLHVHDLVDFVSEEARHCGTNVAAFLKEGKRAARGVEVTAGRNLKYVIPNRCAPGSETRFLMRSLAPVDKAECVVHQGDSVVCRRTIRHVKPAEMLPVVVTGEEMKGVRDNVPVEISMA